MSRLRLLGGKAEEYPGILIESTATTAKQDRQEARLRADAQAKHKVWLASGKATAKWAFAEALQRWARFVGDQRAKDHAYRLLNGLPV